MKKIILLVVLISTTISCEDFEGWNIDDKHPSEVSGKFLFTSAQKSLTLRMQSTSVNNNIFKMFAQHWTETTYTDEANYDLVGRDIGGGFWSDLFRNVLADLNKAKNIITEDTSLDDATKANQLAVADLLQVYTWHVLVDTYGDLPYTETLQGLDNLTPMYDDDEAIYTDLFARIETALTQLANGGDSFGGADLIYHGDVAKWILFANSLKLKMAIRISDVNSGMANTKANEAIAGGVITSAGDNFAFPFESTPPNTNPLWVSLVQSGRHDFVIANTLVDIMVSLNDPRTSVYFDDNKTPFIGGVYGANNTFSEYTQIGKLFHTENFEGMLLSSSEVHFLMAEAAARGFIADAPKNHYDMAVEQNIMYWGLSQADATAYLTQPNIAFDAGNWKKSIGTQKWLSMYARGFEAWSTWRLLDYPNTMNKPAVSELPIPRRYIYPLSEANVNEANYKAASDAMGGDKLESRVFWDKTGQGN
jgi:hypothetical protein